MSEKTRRMSAFGMFIKNRKSASLTNMMSSKKGHYAKEKSASTSNTPQHSRRSSPASSKAGSTSSTPSSAANVMKSLSDLKKIKKMLKPNKKLVHPANSDMTSSEADLKVASRRLQSIRTRSVVARPAYALPLRAGQGNWENTMSPPLNPPGSGKRRSRVSPAGSESLHLHNGMLASPKVEFQHVSGSGLNPSPMKKRRTSLISATASLALNTPPAPSRPSKSTNEVTYEEIPQRRMPNRPYLQDSYAEAQKLFEVILHPVKTEKFFSELWQKKPLFVKRHSPSYNSGWFSTEAFHSILQNERVMFGENLDITSYVDGKRATHNAVGRAYPVAVWAAYRRGCSVRLLNPQNFSAAVWKHLSLLQEYFGSGVGANVYLTPPGTQGFAPHYDDIEAFIVQLEGKKHWKLYQPRSEAETLPMTSSENFCEDDLSAPILDIVLQAGDLLYFPRGTIHQGRCMEDAHSLHITISCGQMNSWGDLLHELVPHALQTAISEDVSFREGLPIDYLNYMGVAFSDLESKDRQTFVHKVEMLMKKMLTTAFIDGACDQLGKRFVHDCLPPVLSNDEKGRSIHGSGAAWDKDEQRLKGSVKLKSNTFIKIIRKGVLRLVMEGESVLVYHCLENSRVYHEVDHQYVEITPEMAPGVEALLLAYPKYTLIEDLPCEDENDKIEIAQILYEKGLIVTEEPLTPESDLDSEEDLAK